MKPEWVSEDWRQSRAPCFGDWIDELRKGAIGKTSNTYLKASQYDGNGVTPSLKENADANELSCSRVQA
jgi:hypothetical protein